MQAGGRFDGSLVRKVRWCTRSNPRTLEPRTPEPLRAAEIRAAAGVAGRSAPEGAAGIAGAVVAARRAARVAAGFVGAAADCVARLVHDLAPAVGPLAGRFTRLLVLLGGGLAPGARLLADGAAPVRTRLPAHDH